MFHVERPRAFGQREPSSVQGRDKRLYGRLGDSIEQAGKVFPVQVRTGLVEEKNHGLLPGPCNQVNLCQRQRGGNKFLLAPRDTVTRSARPNHDPEIGPMRADGAGSHLQVPVPAASQGFSQTDPISPA